MPERHSTIPAFPSHINREHFGSWLSGFVDGEGCFHLGLFKPKANPHLLVAASHIEIALRADDFYAVQLIQSFWQCGSVKFHKPKKSIKKASPGVSFRIYNCVDLKNVVITHFEKYPLIAKKRRDFEIWRQGVELQYAIKHRPYSFPASGKGRLRQWKEQDIETFASFVSSLREQRSYATLGQSIQIPVPSSQPPMPLFA